jgi:methylated-DNA-[protein]-cysteine S-methyltransferase
MGIHTFPSDLGWMALAWTGDRLTRMTFGHPSAAAAVASLQSDDPPIRGDVKAAPAWINELAQRLQSYAAGNDERFDDVPLDLTHLSAFQARVVRACRQISRGRVRTYGELASTAGSAGAARAVGSVMAQNRFPIIIPCHRVVGAAGSLGGFSARDGINTKRRMLEMEGAAIADFGLRIADSGKRRSRRTPGRQSAIRSLQSAIRS